MNDYKITLKNIYRILRINDYPVYSNGVLPRAQLRGLTLVKFWTEYLLFRWRNTEHGKVIWRTAGSKNRYHSELCNRKQSFPFYQEYSNEIFSVLTEQEIYDQTEIFMDFLETHKYSHDNFLKKLHVFLDLAEKNDPLFNPETAEFFDRYLTYYNNHEISDLMIDGWFLTMLTLHAISGEYNNRTALSHIRKDIRFSPDQLLINTDNKETCILPGSVFFFTHKKNVIQSSVLSPFYFYGREPELFDLKDAHHVNKKLLISGISGIGKTELLHQYLQAIIKHKIMVKLAVVQYENNMMESFSRSFLNLNHTTAKERFTEATDNLQTATSYPSIVLIDNMNNPEEDPDTIRVLSQLPCTVIITSVLDQLPGFVSYHMTEPDYIASTLIFRNNYGKVLSENDQKALYQFCEREQIKHPLIIKLLAKSTGFFKTSVEELLQVYHMPANGSTTIENTQAWAEQHLDHLFRTIYPDSRLAEIEWTMLRLFSILPYKCYNAEEILYYAGFRYDSKYLTCLDRLGQKGLLEYYNSVYVMHPMIASYIRKKGSADQEFLTLWELLQSRLNNTSPDSESDIPVREETARLLLSVAVETNYPINENMAATAAQAALILNDSIHASASPSQQALSILCRCQDKTEELVKYKKQLICTLKTHSN